MATGWDTMLLGPATGVNEYRGRALRLYVGVDTVATLSAPVIRRLLCSRSPGSD